MEGWICVARAPLTRIPDTWLSVRAAGVTTSGNATAKASRGYLGRLPCRYGAGGPNRTGALSRCHLASLSGPFRGCKYDEDNCMNVSCKRSTNIKA
ncbi:hypothetical protein B296_00019684 [Ensete ventricosum]|uniref:Uncharacterized protein n=1 Tax=Ensete ventricosum TaxID=4639 RepID=A0A427B293_ENSVE|nr:hypothetical protein B296_00019684 [Ensete ventricosum]